MARDPQNLHGPSLLSQCIQDAPQFPQSCLFALSLLRSYRESLSVTRAKPLVSSRRASYLAASFATTVCASKELYLTAAVAAHEHSWSPLFSATTPAPPSVCFQDALASKIHPYYFDCFRLGAPATSPPGAPKHSGTCASSFPSSSASPPSGQPLSCCLPWHPLHLSYIELRFQSRLLYDCFCGCTSEHSRHYPGCLELGAFQLVSVGLEIQGLLAGAAYSCKHSRSQCRRDALPPRPVQIRTSQPHKEVVSGSFSPRDAELLVVRATDEL